MISIVQIRQKLEQRKGQKIQLEKALLTLKEQIRLQKRSLHRHEKAREVIREVGIKTQEQLQYHISDITSLALEAVFNNPYTLVVEFVQRRNKTECDLLFERDGHKIDPLSASGVGVVDIAAFALRVASWSMAKPHSDNVIMLDEPFKCLSEDYQEKASNMLKEVSKKLGIQFIIVTHQTILTSYADKIFEVSIKKGVSKVTMS